MVRPTAKVTFSVVLLCGLFVAGPGGSVALSQARSGVASNMPASVQAARWDLIVEGVGWGTVQVGMKREDLVKVLGPPDADSLYNWLKWRYYYIDCFFNSGSTGVSEIRFNAGFGASLGNGLRVGFRSDQIIALYGEPDFTARRDNGAMKYGYSKKGILFWTYQGNITQIVAFNPR
jgi:hypothetical protein